MTRPLLIAGALLVIAVPADAQDCRRAGECPGMTRSAQAKQVQQRFQRAERRRAVTRAKRQARPAVRRSAPSIQKPKINNPVRTIPNDPPPAPAPDPVVPAPNRFETAHIDVLAVTVDQPMLRPALVRTVSFPRKPAAPDPVVSRESRLSDEGRRAVVVIAACLVLGLVACTAFGIRLSRIEPNERYVSRAAPGRAFRAAARLGDCIGTACAAAFRQLGQPDGRRSGNGTGPFPRRRTPPRARAA